MYLVSALLDHIHHIYCHNNRYSQFHELCGQIEISFNIRSVYNIQYRIRLFIDKIISCNYFLQCVRWEGVDTRKVHDDNILIPFQFSFFFLNRNPRPVPYKLIGTGQSVKQCRFSAVRISCQSNFNSHFTLSSWQQFKLINLLCSIFFQVCPWISHR